MLGCFMHHFYIMHKLTLSCRKAKTVAPPNKLVMLTYQPNGAPSFMPLTSEELAQQRNKVVALKMLCMI